jgi:hypothetical protein
MKKWSVLYLGWITLMGAACTPIDVCVTVTSGNARECITDASAIYWLHKENAGLVVTQLTDSVLQNLNRYPQFNAPVAVPNGEYQSDLDGNMLKLIPAGNSQGGFIARADAEMGMVFKKGSTGTFMISSTSQECDTRFVTAAQDGWHVEENNIGAGLRVSTNLILTDLDGTRLMTREVGTHSEVTRHKGTVVVLIDNFKMDGASCCDETVFSCCPEGDISRSIAPTSFTSEHLPTNPGYHQQALFSTETSCISVHCEWLRIADCAGRTVQCFNTITCPADLWLGTNSADGAVYSDSCSTGSRAISTCSL